MRLVPFYDSVLPCEHCCLSMKSNKLCMDGYMWGYITFCCFYVWMNVWSSLRNGIKRNATKKSLPALASLHQTSVSSPLAQETGFTSLIPLTDRRETRRILQSNPTNLSPPRRAIQLVSLLVWLINKRDIRRWPSRNKLLDGQANGETSPFHFHMVSRTSHPAAHTNPGPEGLWFVIHAGAIRNSNILLQ
jgi:hypothetical protein